jgi:hypothetical protein
MVRSVNQRKKSQRKENKPSFTFVIHYLFPELSLNDKKPNIRIRRLSKEGVNDRETILTSAKKWAEVVVVVVLHPVLHLQYHPFPIPLGLRPRLPLLPSILGLLCIISRTQLSLSCVSHPFSCCLLVKAVQPLSELPAINLCYTTGTILKILP